MEFLDSIYGYVRSNFSSELVIAALATLVVTIVKLVDYIAKDSHSKADNMHANFNSTLNGLKSDSETERITSAILLRRYINDLNFFKRATTYKKDALNVMSSLLRITTCGEFQKALADSLSFTVDVQHQDFQYANFQNAIIKVSGGKHINMSHADFYQADLSYASINNAKCVETVFCGCNMRNTKFRNCNLRNCDFRGANLSGAKFLDGSECKLEGAKFKNATNIPSAILEHLNAEGVYCVELPKDKYVVKNQEKSLFISRIGSPSPRQNEYINALVNEIKSLGINPIQFTRDKYRVSGQISVIQSQIAQSSGVIIVGLKSIHITEGEYRPSSSDSKKLSNVWLSTPWNHIEAGIASALGKPILVIHQQDLADGVFDRDINDSKIAHVDANISPENFKTVLNTWIHNNI